MVVVGAPWARRDAPTMRTENLNEETPERRELRVNGNQWLQLGRFGANVARTTYPTSLSRTHDFYRQLPLPIGKTMFGRTSFQRRFFVLDEGRLKYYHNAAECEAGKPPLKNAIYTMRVRLIIFLIPIVLY